MESFFIQKKMFQNGSCNTKNKKHKRALCVWRKTKMDIHEKTELQYKFVKAFNKRDKDNVRAIVELDCLVDYYMEGHEKLSNFELIEQMLVVVKDLYAIEIEKDTLSGVINTIGKEC